MPKRVTILFICHGNVCRSPMAEFVFKDMVEKEYLEHEIYIESAATSREELGNPVHPGTRKILNKHGISCAGKYARQMTKKDYEEFDYLIAMDSWNVRNMMRILGSDPEGKVHLLLDYAKEHGDIADPWYTGNFEITYSDILRGCKGLLEYLKNDH